MTNILADLLILGGLLYIASYALGDLAARGGALIEYKSQPEARSVLPRVGPSLGSFQVAPQWNNRVGVELYDHKNDPASDFGTHENANLAGRVT